jgi:hypothetical protein
MEGGCRLAPERFIPLLLTATDVKQTAAPPSLPVKAEIAPAVSNAVVEKAVVYPRGAPALHDVPPSIAGKKKDRFRHPEFDDGTGLVVYYGFQ